MQRFGLVVVVVVVAVLTEARIFKSAPSSDPKPVATATTSPTSAMPCLSLHTPTQAALRCTALHCAALRCTARLYMYSVPE